MVAGGHRIIAEDASKLVELLTECPEKQAENHSQA